MASGILISVNNIDWKATPLLFLSKTTNGKYTDSHGNTSSKNKTAVVVAVKYNVKSLFLETELIVNIAKCKQNGKDILQNWQNVPVEQ